jgi:serine/threonine protein kinase
VAATSTSRCLSENEVLALVRGTLDGTQRAAAHVHLDGCEVCQEVLAALVSAGDAPFTSGARAGPRSLRGPLSPGDEVGRYRIREELGAGAMGVVYLADDRDLDRLAAVKMMQGQADETSDRLLHEAQALARISHPNVIVVYEVGKVSGQVFMAMEFVLGSSLTAWLAQEPRGVGEILEVFAQAGRGLAVAHEAGLVHRDFKPDNVLVGRDGRVRVVDFGLARADAVVVVRAGETADDAATSQVSEGREALRTMTRTAGFVGTPAYMSPEQFDGRQADARSDQFGFCVALYEALYERHPFSCESLAGLIRSVKAGHVEIPQERRAKGERVPRAVAAALERGLRVAPAERFPSMPALLAELAPVAAPRPQSRSRSRSAAIAIATTALVGAGALAFLSPSRSPSLSATTPTPRATSVASGEPAPTTPTTPSAPSSAPEVGSAAAPPARSAAPSRPSGVARPRALPASAPSTASPRGPLMPTTP